MRRRSMTAVLMVTLCVGSLTLTACTGSGRAEPSATSLPGAATTSAPTKSATPSPSPTQPALPAAASKPTVDGAEAFVRYVWALFDYSYEVQDTGAFQKISHPGCKFCQHTIDGVTGIWRDHAKSVGGQITVKTVLVPPADPTSGIVGSVTLR